MKHKLLISTLIVALSISVFGGFYGIAKADVCSPEKLSSAKLGQKGKAVVNIQQCLLDLGYGPKAGATGYFGKQTADSLKNFYQKLAGIKFSGLSFGPSGIKTIKNIFAARKVSSDLNQKGELFKRVASKEELRDYFEKSRQESGYYGFGIGKGVALGIPMMESANRDTAASMAPGAPASVGGGQAERVSETNVQVKGIDEPDIVKTDGGNIYFSQQEMYYMMGAAERSVSSIVAPSGGATSPSATAPNKGVSSMPIRIDDNYKQPQTLAIKAFPPTEMSVLGKIDDRGDLLLLKDKKILVISKYDGFSGYDVSDPAKPEKKWASKFESNNSLITSRLYNGKIYAVTRAWSYGGDICPIPLMKVGNRPTIIPCNDIWRPTRYIPADSTFTAMIINPETGNTEKTISFVGSSNDSIVYMSPNALYVTHYQPYNSGKIYAEFIVSDSAKDLYPQDVVEKIKKVMAYDLGDSAKMVEVQDILEKYLRTLGNDERMKLENNFQNRLSDYVKIHKRDLEKTAIVKINLSDLSIAASGVVPGYPLNQFALDEYNGNLRIATTVAGRRSGLGINESVNDVYVLDGGMSVIGKVEDLGISEKIYSARFVGSKGYVVTFKETDPFYILDLSDPKNPALRGELKIPGYSSYLHPINENRVLGIGKEGQNVKVSLFDVSNPASPVEKSKFTLDEYWSEVLSNHKAFLLDDKHFVFFVPGSKGAYVLSYKDNKLELAKTLSQQSVKRALYLDDYLYIISEKAIAVFNELNWEKAGELTL
ncbi:beta-propeller domain-containing protein [Candidatus Wolfebacteria bacterium]|nr:beta-propeller domain-containing protein [Candidatus Wolfebacteria bacterium]